jgi:hypothetical protein
MLTYITDVREGEHDLLTLNHHQILVIKNLDGMVLHTQVAPRHGWTHNALVSIQPFACSDGADAYLGANWIGSTEV